MKRTVLLVILLATIFTAIFYHQDIGLNLLIYNLLIIGFVIWQKPEFGFMGWMITAGALVTAVFTVVHSSGFVIAMNYISLLLLGGAMVFPQARSLFTFFATAIPKFIAAPILLLRSLINEPGKTGKTGRFFLALFYITVPIVVILIFLLLYQGSNPILNNWTGSFATTILSWMENFLNNLNHEMIALFIFGTWLALFFLYKGIHEFISPWDQQSSDFIELGEKSGSENPMKVNRRMFLRSSLALLIGLNLLILIQNILDIRWIWFGFTWNGEYLREFVHGGTYLLILSLLTSVGLTLIIFFNPLEKEKSSVWIRRMGYLWMAQNLILALSVGFRVYWYIHYFALAYLRIGVLIFLLITILGLIVMILKIRDNRSLFNVHRLILAGGYSILILASLFNWDTIIARYNFSHYKQSFVHLDWICTLSDKTLPDLDKSPEFLREVRQCQDQQFSFEMTYMSPEKYLEIIAKRKSEFREKMAERSILSWNLAESRAMKKLDAGK